MDGPFWRGIRRPGGKYVLPTLEQASSPFRNHICSVKDEESSADRLSARPKVEWAAGYAGGLLTPFYHNSWAKRRCSQPPTSDSFSCGTQWSKHFVSSEPSFHLHLSGPIQRARLGLPVVVRSLRCQSSSMLVVCETFV